VVWKKFTDVSEALAASRTIVLMMEAAGTSETSVNFYQTARRNNPEEVIFSLDVHSIFQIMSSARTSFLR
jgi:hypothetical protein